MRRRLIGLMPLVFGEWRLDLPCEVCGVVLFAHPIETIGRCRG